MTVADDPRLRLRDIAAEKSWKRGTFTLASGKTSDFYFDMKPTLFDPEGAYLSATLILDALANEDVACIGGLELGAVPIAAAVAAQSFAQGQPLPAFFVRKQAKGHGTKNLIEGQFTGGNTVILEDVTTTGGSALKAVDAVRAAGGTVDIVVTLLDRQEGADAAFKDAGIRLIPLLTRADFDGI